MRKILHQYGDIIESTVIPGFAIPVEAAFEEAANLETLHALMR